MTGNKNTNNIHSFDIISERDLQAYVDGQLDARRVRAVETYLARHPGTAEQVEADLACNSMLRDAFPYYDNTEIPPRLIATLNRPKQPAVTEAVKVAAVIALCVASATGGWLAGINTDRTTTTSEAKLAQSGNKEAGQPGNNPPLHTSIPLEAHQVPGRKKANLANGKETANQDRGKAQDKTEVSYPQQYIPENNGMVPGDTMPRVQKQ